MVLGVRAHDINAVSASELCRKLKDVGVNAIQFAPHKSFPDLIYTESSIREIAEIFHENNICTAVYGCYIDPCTPEGMKRFLKHIEYAAILKAKMIATETALSAEEDDSGAKYGALADIFRRFVEKAEKFGINVGVEAVMGHPLSTPELTRALLDKVGSDRLRVILDPVNLAQGQGNPEDLQADAQAESLRAIHLFGGRIDVIHYKAEMGEAIRPILDKMSERKEVCVLTENIPLTSMQYELDRLAAWS